MKFQTVILSLSTILFLIAIYAAIDFTNCGLGVGFWGCVTINANAVATLAGFSFAVFVFFYNAKERNRQASRQHTIKLLLDTRLSAEFRGHLEKRLRYFPERQPIDPETYDRFLALTCDPKQDDTTNHRKRESAQAVRALLNYYEFLALGIARKDLDEAMLKETIRGIMCNFVIDAERVITQSRRENDKAYEHLAKLYEDWHQEPREPYLALI